MKQTAAFSEDRARHHHYLDLYTQHTIHGGHLSQEKSQGQKIYIYSSEKRVDRNIVLNVRIEKLNPLKGG